MSDTLSTLQAALAPKTGMKRIPLPLESYQHPSVPLSAKRLLNMYSEAEPADARTAAALISTPGLAPFLLCPPGPILQMNDYSGEQIYLVSGNHFWRIYNNANVPTAVDLGAIGTTARNYPVTIAVGPLHVVVCVPPNAFYCGHLPTDTAVIPVPFAPAFAGATSVTYLDGYFVYSGVESAAQFFISGLQDPTSYDALDFANADAFPNSVTRVMALHGDVWIVGESGLEVWYDAGSSGLETMPGTSFFPFRRRTGGMIAIPAAHPRSIALGDGSVWWVGRDDAVYRTQGYQAKRVSTHAVERAVYEASGFTALGAGDGSGAFSITNAYCYMERGHLFYVLSFLNTTTMDPVTGGITLAYDANTDKWHDRASGSGGTGRWRGHAAAQYGDWVIFGDYNDGTIWRSIPELGTEGSMQPLRSFTLPPLWAGTKRAFCPRLEIELDVASASPPGPVTLEWSDDGGITWGASRVLQTAGAQGTRQRVFTTRLGSFRNRVFRVSANGHLTVYAVDADITAGAS